MAQIGDPRKLFAYKLGMALSMERTVLSMLKEQGRKASDAELKEGLTAHVQETEQQIGNIEQAFSALGVKASRHSSASAEGLKQEAKELLGKVPEELVDAIILGAATHTEHHEISTYEGLISMAEAMGEDDLVALLQENLEQEQAMLRQVQEKTQQLAPQLAAAEI